MYVTATAGRSGTDRIVLPPVPRSEIDRLRAELAQGRARLASTTVLVWSIPVAVPLATLIVLLVLRPRPRRLFRPRSLVPLALTGIATGALLAACLGQADLMRSPWSEWDSGILSGVFLYAPWFVLLNVLLAALLRPREATPGGPASRKDEPPQPTVAG
jgi:hypothetical protein